jgi:hypothetical protein
MKMASRKAVAAVAVLVLAGVAGVSAMGQQGVVSPESLACGGVPANFTVTREPGQSLPTSDKTRLTQETRFGNAKDHPIVTDVPPLAAGKARVYVIEAMLHYPFVTEKVNIGMDGTWLGATDANTWMSFDVLPGTHHLCAVYQGHAEGMDTEGRVLLLHLEAKAGETYYVRYHAQFLKDSPGMAFFDYVDEDEGSFLLQHADHVTSTLKK